MATYTIEALDTGGTVVATAIVTATGTTNLGSVSSLFPTLPAGDYTFRAITPGTGEYAVGNVAPSLIELPEISGEVIETQQVSVHRGVYEGTPSITDTENFVWSVFQNGVDVTSDYTMTNGVVTGAPPDATAGQTWVYTETADNGVGETITNQIEKTVQDYVAPVAPSFTVTGTLDYEVAPEPQIIYVDYEGGSTGVSGTDIASPRKTAPTGGVLAPGSQIIFKGGVKYREPITIEDVGEADNRISYLSNPDGNFGTGAAIIDGGTPVTGWGAAETVQQATVYRNSATFSRSRLYVQDGELLTVAQMPAVPTENVHKVIGNTYTADSRGTDVSGNPTFTDPSVFNNLSSSPVGSFLWVRTSGNQESLREITAYDAGTGTVTVEPSSDGLTIDQDIYAIYNHPDGLALKDGTYIFDRDTNEVLVRTVGDVDISTTDIVVMGGGTAIENKGSFITIDGFIIQNWTGRGIWAQDGETQRFGNTSKNLTMRNFTSSAGSFGAISHYNQTDGRIENVTISDAIGSLRGVMVNGCFNHVVKNADIQRTKGTLISNFGGDGNSYISVTGKLPAGTHSNGMSNYTGGKNILVAFCEFILEQNSFALTHQDSESHTYVFNNFASAGLRVVSGHVSGTAEKGGHFIANNNIIQLKADDTQGYARTTEGDANSTTIINNISDGLQSLRTSIFDMLLVEKNALLTASPGPDDYDASADRSTIFTKIEPPDADLDLAASPPAYLSSGSVWTFQPDPSVAAVTVDWVGRYNPADGSEAIDPTTLFMEV